MGSLLEFVITEMSHRDQKPKPVLTGCMWQTTAQLGALHTVVTPTNTQEGHIIFPPECARAVTELGDSLNLFIQGCTTTLDATHNALKAVSRWPHICYLICTLHS